MARTMLLDANLSDWYWLFAVHAAIHIENRISHSNLLSNKTTLEFWYYHKMNLSYLRLLVPYVCLEFYSQVFQNLNHVENLGSFSVMHKTWKGMLSLFPILTNTAIPWKYTVIFCFTVILFFPMWLNLPSLGRYYSFKTHCFTLVWFKYHYTVFPFFT